MAFSEALKAKVRKRAHLACCLCKSIGIEIHHVVPQEEGGADTEENAAPLCPSCHETYGANPTKRKFIREARDLWYEICEARYASDAQQIEVLRALVESLSSTMNSSSFPLLPFAMFCTIRHYSPPDAIEAVFGRCKGYKSSQSKVLRHVSTAFLGGYGLYNSIEEPVTHSNCTLSPDQMQSLIEKYSGWGDGVIKSPNSISVEFTFPTSEASAREPALVLKSSFDGTGKPSYIRRLSLFDEVIFQDSFFTRWEVRNPTKTPWGVANLHRASIRLRFEFLSFDPLNFERPPRLHNLNLYFGRESPHVLYFRAKQLEAPEVSEKSDLNIHWDFSAVGMDAKPLRVEYCFEIDDELYFNQIKQIS